MTVRLSREESTFRNARTFAVDAKAVNLESVLVNLFMQIRHDGKRVKSRVRGEHTVESIGQYLRNAARTGEVVGAAECPDAAEDWVRCNLVNFVHRGDVAKEKVSALRPMHLEAYRVRNAKHSRDYAVADQIYLMLKANPEALALLKEYLGRGFDARTGAVSPSEGLDVDTAAILHLAKKVQIEPHSVPRTFEPEPLLKSQAGLFCDDILRLLWYRDALPRSVFADYLRILCAFHVAIYAHKTIALLPRMVALGTREVEDGWSMVVDASGRLDSPLEAIACADMARTLNRLNDYIRATFAVNIAQRWLERTESDVGIDRILAVLKERPERLQAYAETRMDDILAKFAADEEDEKAELKRFIRYEKDAIDQYAAILAKVRGPYQQKYHVQFFDNISMKNGGSAFLAGGRVRNSRHPRRGILGARLLELLVHLLVLRGRDGGGFEAHALSVVELMDAMRERYGLVVDGTKEARFAGVGVETRLAFRANVEAFKDRLRQIGFYTDLSDAGTLQKVRPRYTKGAES